MEVEMKTIVRLLLATLLLLPYSAYAEEPTDNTPGTSTVEVNGVSLDQVTCEKSNSTITLTTTDSQVITDQDDGKTVHVKLLLETEEGKHCIADAFSVYYPTIDGVLYGSSTRYFEAPQHLYAGVPMEFKVPIKIDRKATKIVWTVRIHLYYLTNNGLGMGLDYMDITFVWNRAPVVEPEPPQQPNYDKNLYLTQVAS